MKTPYWDCCVKKFGCFTEVALGNTGCTTSNGVTDSCDDGNAVCGPGNKCVCKSGYYDDNGDSALGTCRRSKLFNITKQDQ